jgi:hypothetical protein
MLRIGFCFGRFLSVPSSSFFALLSLVLSPAEFPQLCDDDDDDAIQASWFLHGIWGVFSLKDHVREKEGRRSCTLFSSGL